MLSMPFLIEIHISLQIFFALQPLPRPTFNAIVVIVDFETLQRV